jgi:hypothetical protein
MGSEWVPLLSGKGLSNHIPHNSTYPARHVLIIMVQLLLEQVVVAICLEASPVHVIPQPPQLSGSSAGWVSQPSVGSLLQSWYLCCSKQQEWQAMVISVGKEEKTLQHGLPVDLQWVMFPLMQTAATCISTATLGQSIKGKAPHNT